MMPEDWFETLAARCDLLRRRRLARDRARPRFAVGLADPVPPPVRPVREPAAVPADAGHSEPARERRRRATSTSSSCARTPKANIRRSAAACSRAPSARSCSRSPIFSRKGVDRILQFAFELARTRTAKHLTSATKSNGISITMPYWDERFQEMAGRYPGIRTDQFHIDILAAHFVARPERFDVVVGSNLFGDILSDLGPAVCGTIGIAPSGNINPERATSVAVRARARLGAGHRGQGHRQSDRPDLVRRADAGAPGPS